MGSSRNAHFRVRGGHEPYIPPPSYDDFYGQHSSDLGRRNTYSEVRHPQLEDVGESFEYRHGAAGKMHMYEREVDHGHSYASGRRGSGLAESYERQPEAYAPSTSTPRIPLIQRAESGKENEIEEGLLSPRRFSEQVGAFGEMCNAGAGWGSALVAALQGHKMTEEQAALCLQSHWRRHEAAVSLVARDMAAAHIQQRYREQQYYREGAIAAMQAAMHGDRHQRDIRMQEAWAATRINAAWRGHLSRVHTQKLRGAPRKSLRKSFSFSHKKKPRAAAAPAASGPQVDDWWGNQLPPAAANAKGSTTLAKRVRRSLSFDRKSSSSSSSSSATNSQSLSCTRRTFVLERGPQGLGLELDATNTVVTIKLGGRAEHQGLLQLGDTILTIDGRSCAHALMQDVMVHGRSVYVVEVSRPERATYIQQPKVSAGKGIRRSLSFDSKKTGGVRRSFSFGR